MSYNDFLGTLNVPDEKSIPILESRKRNSEPKHEYDNVRFGLPNGALNFEKEKEGREILIKHFLACGYRTWPSSKLNLNLKRHVALFRARLDLWEELCGQGSMSKDEIYYRCLTEGVSFTDWVKKARSMSFRAYTSETNTDIDDNYLLSNYKGYNSIIQERYLIHWDPSEECDDVKYAFVPAENRRLEDFRKIFLNFIEDFRLREVEVPEDFDMIGSLKNSVMYDPKKKKSILMREFWNEDIDCRGPYFATRRVVPIEAGNVRDTGVGDPGTILKIKQLNMLARLVSERVPYCANAPEKICNSRLKRVLKRNAFLHLDFKKFGLTFPRGLQNIVIEELGKAFEIDVSHLIIRDFFIEIDKEVYKTERGAVLGWLDPINCLAVCAILHYLSINEELAFDFISFNDDVEISKFCESDIPGTLELLRMAIVSELDSFDIAISLDKTFGSKGSVFLERYAYFDQYGLDMYKEQLTVKAYSESLVTEYPWQAKLYHSAAEMWTKNDYATDRCIMTCPTEFRLTDNSMSLWSGGWFIYRKDKLDYSLIECDPLAYLVGYELSKFKPKVYSSRREKTTPNSDIYRMINDKAYNSNSSDLGKTKFKDVPQISDINQDIELIRASIDSMLVLYQGRNEQFPLRISWLIGKSLRSNHHPLEIGVDGKGPT